MAHCVYSSVCTLCLKNSQNFFHYNFVKFQPILIIFNTDMAKAIDSVFVCGPTFDINSDDLQTSCNTNL